MKTNIFNNIASLMQKLEFPAASALEINQACIKISESNEALSLFFNVLDQYEESISCNYGDLDAKMRDVSRLADIHNYSGSLIMYLAFCAKLKERYDERGISDDVFYNTVSDLKYKCEECRLVYGVCGNFTVGWMPGFFTLSRFGLGRLQFEIVDLKMEIELDGVKLDPPVKAINVHIPRTGGRLDKDAVKEAYEMASDFFKDTFKDIPTVFTCHSWLLYPWNLEVLSPTSNLRAFCTDYKIISTADYPNYNDAWRLFDCLYTGDASALPRDSSLRRAYADRIARGEPMGNGLGVFIYKQ